MNLTKYSPVIACAFFVFSFFSCSDDGLDGLDGQSTLVNVLDEPAGENCASGGLRIETGIDANSNGTLETDEVQSVSYVCDGESLADEGQTYLVLTGDITNEEAQAKVDAEVGENTQLIVIKSTSNLTTLEIPQTERLTEIQIDGNRALGTVNLPNLLMVDDGIVISDNPSDSLKIKMNALLEVKGNLELVSNDILEVEMNSLEKISQLKVSDEFDFELTLPQLQEILSLEIIDNIGDLVFDFPELIDLGDLYFNDNLIATFSLNAPQINEIVFFEVGGNQLISRTPLVFNEAFGLTALDDIGTLSFEDNTLFSSLNIPLLRNASSITIFQNSNLSSITMDDLVALNVLRIQSNASLTSVDFTSLEDAGTDFGIFQNSSLTDLNLDAISSTSDNSLSFNDNAFTGTLVNYVLARLASITPPLSGVTINLQQSSPAPPTGQGLTDKGTLENAGNTVNTD